MPVKKINKKTPKPDLQISYVSVKSINPHPRNARIHDEDNIAAIIESLKKFGQRTPLVLGGNSETRQLILKGCGTYEAMKRLKFSTIAIVRAQNMTIEDELAYSLADNKTTDTSEFNFEGVADILKFLDEREYNLASTGFADFEIEPLLEADWNPGKENEMPGNDPNAIAATLKFTAEQYGILEQAFELGVTADDFKKEIQLVPALIKICEIYNFIRSEQKPQKVSRRVTYDPAKKMLTSKGPRRVV